MTITTRFALPLLFALAAACASYPAPTARLTSTEAAIRGAMEVGAGQVPRAALHLKLAEEQAEKARSLLQDGYNERADQTLKRAQADAELALAIAREAQGIEKVQEAQGRLQKAQAEVMKKSR